eukprot:2451569-Prymnesium_polylepis.1
MRHRMTLAASNGMWRSTAVHVPVGHRRALCGAPSAEPEDHVQIASHTPCSLLCVAVGVEGLGLGSYLGRSASVVGALGQSASCHWPTAPAPMRSDFLSVRIYCTALFIRACTV